MRSDITLYEKVVAITSEYLGPAASRFVARQISNHINTEPMKLQRNDLASFIDWASLAMASLIEDQIVVNQYIAELESLAYLRKSKVENALKPRSAVNQ